MYGSSSRTSVPTASPLDPSVPSSHSSASSSFCSPASTSSRPPPSSGQSSPPGDGPETRYDELGVSAVKAGTTTYVERGQIPSRIGGDHLNLPNEAVQTGSAVALLTRKAGPPLSFADAQQAMVSASEKREQSNAETPSSTHASSFADGAHLTDQAGPSRTIAIPTAKHDRPASKSRRMSPGGSRMPSDDPEFRNGYGRSASDSGSEWYHASKGQSGGGAGGRKPHAAVEEESGWQSDVQQTAADDLSESTDGSWSHQPAQPGERNRAHVRPRLDLATFPAQDLLRVLAALLHQIATANDQLRPRNGASPGEEKKRRQRRERNAAPEMALATPSGAHASGDELSMIEGNDWLGDSESKHTLHLSHSKPTTAALGALHTSSSTLCFRARNIPSISIEAYLLRILRYCPASCEVFVSLLVYFDRMSKMGQRNDGNELGSSGNGRRAGKAVDHTDEGSVALSSKTGMQADEGDGDEIDDGLYVGMRGFAIDSFNVHRLVIAGVTVASKFFSDVFYTNSRYAKVGGLPVHELNQLELQFLLLNDFSLMISLEEMQRYADQLLVYGGAAGSSSSAVEGRQAASEDPPAGRTAETDGTDTGAMASVRAAQTQPPVATALSSAPRTHHDGDTRDGMVQPTAKDVHGDTAMRET